MECGNPDRTLTLPSGLRVVRVGPTLLSGPVKVTAPVPRSNTLVVLSGPRLAARIGCCSRAHLESVRRKRGLHVKVR
jgi:hypothetical protein